MINELVRLPVLRPLVTMDKIEIIDYARKIGTYDISILPYEDCCSLFVPKHPATRPNLQKVREAEEKLDIPSLLEGSLEKPRCWKAFKKPASAGRFFNRTGKEGNALKLRPAGKAVPDQSDQGCH